MNAFRVINHVNFYYFALQALFKNYPLGAWKTQNLSCCCYLFSRAAVVNHCGPCGLKHKSVFSHGSQDWKSCIKGSQDWAALETLGWNPSLLLPASGYSRLPWLVGLWLHHCTLCLHLHIPFSSLTVSLLCVSSVRTLVIGFKSCRLPQIVQNDLILRWTWWHQQRPFFQMKSWSQVPRHPDPSSGGHHSNPQWDHNGRCWYPHSGAHRPVYTVHREVWVLCNLFTSTPTQGQVAESGRRLMKAYHFALPSPGTPSCWPAMGRPQPSPISMTVSPGDTMGWSLVTQQVTSSSHRAWNSDFTQWHLNVSYWLLPWPQAIGTPTCPPSPLAAHLRVKKQLRILSWNSASPPVFPAPPTAAVLSVTVSPAVNLQVLLEFFLSVTLCTSCIRRSCLLDY